MSQYFQMITEEERDAACLGKNLCKELSGKFLPMKVTRIRKYTKRQRRLLAAGWTGGAQQRPAGTPPGDSLCRPQDSVWTLWTLQCGQGSQCTNTGV